MKHIDKGTSATTIVWLRRDLRLADNPALHAAAQLGAVVPVYILDEPTSWPMGEASRWWLHQSLHALGTALNQAGSKLILREGPAAATLLMLSQETGAQRVVWNRRYEPAGIEADTATKQMLRENGLDVESYPGNLLAEPWTIQNQTGKPFQVFTPFWKTLQKASFEKPLLAPKLLAPSIWPKILDLKELDLEPAPDWTAGFREVWQPGELGATQRLADFGKIVTDYTSNRDLPDIEGTSRLSPHLTFGEISPRQIWHASLPWPDSEPYRRQLAWRDFAHHLLYHFPRTPDHPLRADFERFPWKMDAAAFRAWRRGLTGYPIVDAGMRELWHTGWMHNRVRMVVASFLVKDLLIPWQEGAHWFWDTLVDADLANNTLGWQWVAGCGADAAPYFRIFSPVLQGEKFDGAGAYVRKWVPEVAKLPNEWIQRPWEAPADVLLTAGIELGGTYPHPVVQHAQAREQALAALATLKSR